MAVLRPTRSQMSPTTTCPSTSGCQCREGVQRTANEECVRDTGRYCRGVYFLVKNALPLVKIILAACKGSSPQLKPTELFTTVITAQHKSTGSRLTSNGPCRVTSDECISEELPSHRFMTRRTAVLSLATAHSQRWG